MEIKYEKNQQLSKDKDNRWMCFYLDKKKDNLICSHDFFPLLWWITNITVIPIDDLYCCCIYNKS